MKFCSSIGLSRSLRLLGLAFFTALLTVCLPLHSGRSLSLFTPAAATVTSDQPRPAMPEIAQTKQAQQLLQQGRDHYAAEQFAAAIAAWAEAANLFANQQDRLNQAISTSSLALAHRQLGHWPEAEAAIQESFRLLEPEEALTDQGLRIYGQALNTRGSVYLAQGQTKAALSAWEKATEVYTRADYSEGIVKSLINQAHALRSLGFFRQSRDRLEETYRALDEVTDSPLKVVLTRSLGETQRLLGHLGNLEPLEPAVSDPSTESLPEEKEIPDSLSILGESLESAKALGLSTEMAKTHISLGDTLRAIAQQQAGLAQRSGQPQDKKDAVDGYKKALAEYQAALDLYQANAASMPLMLSIRVALNQFETLQHLERFEQAQPMLKSWDKAQLQKSVLAQLDALPASRSSTFAQIKLAHLLMDVWVEEPTTQIPTTRQQVYDLLAAAKRQAESLGDAMAESYALGYLGHLYEIEKQYGDAQKFSEAALALSNQQPSIAYQWQWQLGRIESEFHSEENQARTLWYYDQAFQNVKAVRNDLLYLEPDVQFDFRDRTEKLYREYISLLLPEKGPEKAADISEDITLSSALIQAKTVINELRVAELESFLACGLLEPDSPIKQVSIEKIVNDDRNVAIIYPIILPSDSGGDRLEVLIQLPEQNNAPVIKQYPSQVIFAEPVADNSQILSSPIEAKLEKFRRELERPYFSSIRGKPLAEDIYAWLIHPAESAGWLAPPIDTLVFVLDGAFRNVPMAALRDGDTDKFLIEKYAIAVTFGDLQLPKAAPAKSFRALAAGLSEDPNPLTEETNNDVSPSVSAIEFDTFGPLYYVQAEIQKIAEKLADTTTFLNKEFTRENVQDTMRSSAYNIVHLATHGEFGFTRNDTFLLAAASNASDTSNQPNQTVPAEGIDLNSFDILLSTRSRIPLELLVLSACETATGDSREVLGITGLAIQSGARSTLATLWSISDLSTSVLMETFYEKLVNQGLSKAQALQQAQAELITRGYKPSRWSPYLLAGDWR